VCIPAYRAERHLAATLESVGAQTFADWEVVVTEDGSRDRTEEIVRAFAATVSQPVRYTRHEVNRGLPATRNTGLAAASAPVLALLDADDLWTPDHLAIGLAALSHPTASAAVWSPCAIFDDATGVVIGRRELDPADRDRDNLAAAGLQAGLHRRQARIFAGAGHQAAAEAAPPDHKWIPMGVRFVVGSGGDHRAGPDLGNGPSLPLVSSGCRVFCRSSCCPAVSRSAVCTVANRFVPGAGGYTRGQ
jgi:glycosyltransferase involved in cell wall biosynthesis